MTWIRSNLTLLPVLQVLLTECSISRTAAQLNLTQSAISQVLGRARKVWRDELLVRQGQRMFPTPLAVELAAKIDTWMADTHILFAPSGSSPTEREAQIVFIANDYSEIALIPPVLKKLRERAPRITPILRSIEARPLDSPDFLEGRIHFALAGISPPPGPFDVQPLFEERFVLIARHGHPGVHPGLSLEEYTGLQHALVSPQGRGVSGPIDDYLASLNTSRRIALSLSRFTSLPYLLASTDMVSTVPARFAALRSVRDICRVVELPFPSPVFTMSLIWHRRYRKDSLHQWIRSLAIEEISAVAGSLTGPSA